MAGVVVAVLLLTTSMRTQLLASFHCREHYAILISSVSPKTRVLMVTTGTRLDNSTLNVLAVLQKTVHLRTVEANKKRS